MYSNAVPPATHRAAFKRFFVPFARSCGECLVSGMQPSEIAPDASGYSVRKMDTEVWRIQFEAGRTLHDFPYWVLDNEKALKFTLLVPTEPDAQPFQALLSEVWDPHIITNPQAVIQPSSLAYAKKTTKKTESLWLAFLIHTRSMRIAIIGGSRQVSTAYRDTLAAAKAGPHFTGWELGDPDPL